jgi:hypothetical protein
MKRTYYAVLIAAAFSLPSLSHADTASASITRAQVRAELVAAEQVGQYPHVYPSYPDSVSNASFRYVSDRAAVKAAAESSYGPEITGHSEAGAGAIRVRAVADNPSPLGNVFRGRK